MRRRILVAGFAAVTLTLAGCSSDVSGVAEPDGAAGAVVPDITGPGTSGSTGSGTGTGTIAAPLSSMLLTPADFPAKYEALVLPDDAVEQATSDLDGIPAGATVDPAGCKPPPQEFGPDAAALIVGTDNAARATISVELARVDRPLATREAELEQCPEVTTTRNGATATVTTTMLPAPPLNADDTMAIRQTVTSGNADQKVTQSMLRLVAQVDDVRISATHMSFGDAAPDSAALDQLFTEAVQKVTAAQK